MNAKLLLGILGACVGAAIGAIAWAAITATTSFQIGYMAVGVGLLAGYGMRLLSGGRDRAGGIAAGVIALLGCMAGNVLTAVVVVAQHEHYNVLAASLGVATKPALAFELLRDGFDVMDLLFYAIAVYAGYRTALAPPKRTPAAAPGPAMVEAPVPAVAEAPVPARLPPEERTT